ncbi:MAG: cytochrome c3 family protein [Vicinamibacteria bacterium]
MDLLSKWTRPLAFLGRNPVSLTGVTITTASGVTLVFFLIQSLFGGGHHNPYEGIFLFLVLPAFFVLGLLLMPIGVILRRRALRARGELPSEYPKLDLSQPLLRNAVLIVGVATFVNVCILGTAGYQGVEHMESVEFCGTTCHTVMQPEYTAYLGSPHSRVTCTQCHIGPGASWFVKSKLDGTRQVLATALDTYSRPIPSPVHTLRPARETCEQCHWPRKFHGDKLVVKTKYSEDEANTRLVTVLMMRIGGHEGQSVSGIHGRHLADGERIRYVASDERRQHIERVTWIDDAGRPNAFLSEAAQKDPRLGQGEERRMDCVDCHNRPTHAFDLPERAIDRALEEGRIARDLPWVKKAAVAIMKADYASREAAGQAIPQALADYYRKELPQVFAARQADVAAAGAATRDAWLRNVFPAMKVTWGTHPNNIGHEDFPGCFRCHDDGHKDREGKAISQDCEACHAILAMEEADPKILADLGMK